MVAGEVQRRLIKIALRPTDGRRRVRFVTAQESFLQDVLDIGRTDEPPQQGGEPSPDGLVSGFERGCGIHQTDNIARLPQPVKRI